jgi:hypothetical protein
MPIQLPSKDPLSKEPYFIIWCDKLTGLNDGSRKDRGELQGATIVTATWTVPDGITKESSNQAAVFIAGISYEQDTVTTIWLSGGMVDKNYSLTCLITISDGRILDSKTIVIPVRDL